MYDNVDASLAKPWQQECMPFSAVNVMYTLQATCSAITLSKAWHVQLL